MTGRYDDDAASALEAINEDGGLITITAKRQQAVNAGTDRPAAPPTRLSATPKAVVLPVARKYIGADLFESGQLITVNHRMALIAPSTIVDAVAGMWEPMQGDTVVADTTKYTVIGMLTIKPDSITAVLHILFMQS